MSIEMRVQNASKAFNNKSTPCQQLEIYNNVSIKCKRDDLNHSIIQGNKLRKLKYNILEALKNNTTHIVTFGGAYSNHVIATAYASKLANLKAIGFIRGQELKDLPHKWSATLQDAHEAGMELVFLSRQDYRLKEKSAVVKKYLIAFKNNFIIPEGGSNALALKGVTEVIDELDQQTSPPTHIITACGTGGTCAGLIDGVAKHGWKTSVIGVPVLKGAEFLLSDIKSLLCHHSQVSWELFFDYHGGGYAKIEQKHIAFAKRFTKHNSILLDKIYNVKSFYAMYDLIDKGVIKSGSSVVILHTGGLQGGTI